MNNTLKDLLEIIEKNPDLPIYCKIYDDIFCPLDDYNWTLSSITKVTVENLYCFREKLYTNEELLIEEIYSAFDNILDEKFNYNAWKTSYAVETGKCSEEEYQKNQEAENKIESYIKSIIEPYRKSCIMVSIDDPVGYIEDMYDRISEKI